MTKHVDELRKEIWKDPSNDAPRAVLADYLEQEGEVDRAKLIHLQLREHSLPSWDARSHELELQIRALLHAHDNTWRSELPALRGVQWGAFSRGFVDAAAFEDFAVFEEHRATCLAAAPLQRIALHWPYGVGKRAKLPRIDTLRHLTMVGGVMSPDDLKWLGSCPLLSTVRELDLLDSELESGLPNLLKSAKQLEALRIPLHQLGNAGIKKLIATDLPNLGELVFSAGPAEQAFGSGRRGRPMSVTSKGMLEFAAWPGLAKLHTLDVSHCKLGSEGVLMLLASPYTKNLKSLTLREIKDSDWDMDDSLTAFKSGPAGTLDELDISDNDLDPDGAHYLAECKALRELKVLRIGSVRSKSFDRLAKASWVRSLRVLACDDQALPHFLRRVPEQLHRLVITPSSAPLSKVVPYLEANPPPALRFLDLTGSRVDDDGLRMLGKLDLPLTSIALPEDNFSLGALQAFVASPLGSRLLSLHANNPAFDRLPAPSRVEVGDGDDDGHYRYL